MEALKEKAVIMRSALLVLASGEDDEIHLAVMQDQGFQKVLDALDPELPSFKTPTTWGIIRLFERGIMVIKLVKRDCINS